MGSEKGYDHLFGTAEREFQLERAEDANDLFRPKSVLEIGYPKYAEVLLDTWDCDVDTVDPDVDEATYKVKFEDFVPEKQYDLIHMSSVLDYFDDPVGCLRKVRDCGNAALLQCRLNTYQSAFFRDNYWCTTKRWVEERAAIELGLEEVEWMDFMGNTFFSICGRIR